MRAVEGGVEAGRGHQDPAAQRAQAPAGHRPQVEGRRRIQREGGEVDGEDVPQAADGADQQVAGILGRRDPEGEVEIAGQVDGGQRDVRGIPDGHRIARGIGDRAEEEIAGRVVDQSHVLGEIAGRNGPRDRIGDRIDHRDDVVVRAEGPRQGNEELPRPGVDLDAERTGGIPVPESGQGNVLLEVLRGKNPAQEKACQDRQAHGLQVHLLAPSGNLARSGRSAFRTDLGQA